MKEPEIRKAVHKAVLMRHRCDSSTRIIDEMSLCRGKARIDIAVINGELSGVEIKSTQDTLIRLPRQSEIYGAIFDRVTLVMSQRHFVRASGEIPHWWGIQVALPGFPVLIEEVREAAWNDDVKSASLVELLWRDEALCLLAERNEDKPVRHLAKKHVWKRLVEVIPRNELRSLVRETMKVRRHWRVDS